jgi:hypothetical protein
MKHDRKASETWYTSEIYYIHILHIADNFVRHLITITASVITFISYKINVT